MFYQNCDRVTSDVWWQNRNTSQRLRQSNFDSNQTRHRSSSNQRSRNSKPRMNRKQSSQWCNSVVGSVWTDSDSSSCSTGLIFCVLNTSSIKSSAEAFCSDWQRSGHSWWHLLQNQHQLCVLSWLQLDPVWIMTVSNLLTGAQTNLQTFFRTSLCSSRLTLLSFLPLFLTAAVCSRSASTL